MELGRRAGREGELGLGRNPGGGMSLREVEIQGNVQIRKLQN